MLVHGSLTGGAKFQPEIANGFKRNVKKQRTSRESTPIREMGPRAETPVYLQDHSSRESTPQLVSRYLSYSIIRIIIRIKFTQQYNKDISRKLLIHRSI